MTKPHQNLQIKYNTTFARNSSSAWIINGILYILNIARIKEFIQIKVTGLFEYIVSKEELAQHIHQVKMQSHCVHKQSELLQNSTSIATGQVTSKQSDTTEIVCTILLQTSHYQCKIFFALTKRFHLIFMQIQDQEM